ncbi:MAG: LytTR family DNA-binding domain-containing protein [Chitinophagaceae bacterium]
MYDPEHIRCVIVDDEHLSVKLVADYVNRTPGLTLLLQTTRVEEAMELVQKGVVDLLFLDIQMPVLNGLQFMQLIGDRCKVILTTAYPEYALESYEHNAVDYLLKPITFERFLTGVKRAKERLEFKAWTNNALKKNPDHIFIKTTYRIQKVDLGSIFYLEGLRDYIAVHTTAARILTLESMKKMEELLPSDQFIRIHKSYIINRNKIDFLSRSRVVINNIYLPVGDTYKEKFLQWLDLPK